MRRATIVAGLLAVDFFRHAVADCTKDAFEPDYNATTGAVLVGGTSQQRNFCDDSEDWMSIPVCPGRAYSLDTSALGAAADTLIELYSQDGTTLLYAEPDHTGHLAWAASASQNGTLHARVSQRDGTHGDLRDYQIHLTGDTSPCTIGVTSVTTLAGEPMLFQAIAQSVDGGFVTVGSRTPVPLPPALAMTRWNNDGTIGWIREVGDGTIPAGNDIARTADGGFVAVAYYSGGAQGSLIAKLTDGGAVSWQRLYGSENDDGLLGIAASADGSIYAACFSVPTPSTGVYDGWLLKLNSLGAADWSPRVGGALSEQFYDVQALKDGGAVAAGAAERFAGSSDAFLLETSATGAVLKQTVFHTNQASTDFQAVRPLAGGGYVAGGNYCTTIACSALVLKLTAAGTIAWQRTLSWPGSSDPVTSIDVLQDGSVYAHIVRTGNGNETPVLTGWDTNGTLLWQSSLGTVQPGGAGIVADDGGIAVGYGYGSSLRLARTDASGNVPNCAAISPAGGIVGTPALTASASNLGTAMLVEPAPSASFAITSSSASVANACACFRTMNSPIFVDGKMNTTISWANDGFGPYDLVRGDLATLKATGGDFTAALNAIPSDQQCLAQGLSATMVVDSYSQPLPDTGYWYLLRGANGACPSIYDESVHQVGHRDAEIAAASGACP